MEQRGRFAAMLAVAWFMCAGGGPSSGQVNPAASPNEADGLRNVAVLDFQVVGSGVDPSIGEALASVIRSALVRGQQVRLIERSELAAVLTEQNLQVTDMVDPATAVELGRIAGVDRLVLGSIAAVENTYTLTCRVIDVATGEAAEAEEFVLQTMERYPQLGRLLAVLIGEQPITPDSIAAAPHLSQTFSKTDCKLKLGISDKTQSGAVVDKGRYVMVKGSAGNQYSWLPGVKGGFHLQADLAQLDGPPNGGCGLVWGAKGTDSYLGVWIDGRQGVRIERRQGGTANTGLVRKRDWPVIHRPPRSNRLRVESWDDRHRVFVNGVCVDDFYEPGYRDGRVGLRVFQRAEGTTVRWAVDNLVVGAVDPSLAGIAVETPGTRTVTATPTRKRPKRIARSTKPWGRIDKVWVTGNTGKQPKGINVHASFEIGNRKGAKLRAVARFFNARTGRPLKDRDKRFCSADGRVAAERVFSPRHRVSTFSDLALFIPISQLHLPPGSAAVKCRLVLLDLSEERPVKLARSEEITFRLPR